MSTASYRDTRCACRVGLLAAVKAFKGLNFYTCVAGDPYNDTLMLEEADAARSARRKM